MFVQLHMYSDYVQASYFVINIHSKSQDESRDHVPAEANTNQNPPAFPYCGNNSGVIKTHEWKSDPTQLSMVNVIDCCIMWTTCLQNAMTSMTEHTPLFVLLDGMPSHFFQCHQDFEAEVHNPGQTKTEQTEGIGNKDIQNVNCDHLKGTITHEQWERL